MRRRRLASLVGVLALMATWLTATSASAEVIGFEPFAETSTFTYSECGYPIRVEAHTEGKTTFRRSEDGDASFFFATGKVTYREVHTNTLTGERFVVRGRYWFRDLQAIHVEGSVYRVTRQETGQPFTVEDASGRVLARTFGALRLTLLIDTGGDGDPASEAVGFVDLELRGEHPAFDRHFCSFAGDLVGLSDSSDRYTVHPEGTTTSPLGYVEYLPPDYGDDGRSPLLVFLHGFGESGDGSAEQLELLTATAIPAYIAFDGWPADRPFVVLAPQHEVADELSPPCFTPDEIQSFLAYAVAAYDVDPSRVYVTGLSCGAIGAWNYLGEHGSSQVAAVVPVAGDGRPAWEAAGCRLGDVPLWAFHGDADDVVDPQGSIEPITRLRACTAPPAQDARLTVYPDVGHDSWTATYALGAQDDIYLWMLGHRTP